MVDPEQRDTRRVLDETANSIKQLVVNLENGEMQGRRITASEIQSIASQLQGHVEHLLAASRSLRNGKSGA